MIVAINYADFKYRKAQKFNSATAIDKGKVDKVISYSPKDIDKEFRKKNQDILSARRGNGYWLWKPYFVKKTLMTLQEDDYLIYLDSGAFYINDVKYLIRQMEKDSQNIMVFELPFKESHYTKRDIFISMECDETRYINSNQRMATMIIIKKSDKSLKFVDEWLEYGQKGTIITDERNKLGKSNYGGFVDNRHDQSILSLLSKKYKIKAYRDPSQYGRFPDIFWKKNVRKLEDTSDYPQIVVMHRCSKVTKFVYWEQMLFAYAPKKVVLLYFKLGLIDKVKQNNEKIAILTDNMPIKDEAYGTGMCKVVNKLAEALDDKIDSLIITDVNYSAGKLDKAFKSRAAIMNRFHSSHIEILSDIIFLYEIWEKMEQMKRKRIKKLFIPLGADYKELRRAYLVSKIYHMSVGIYIVDDFIEYQKKIVRNKKGEKIEKKIIRYIKGINRIFVISKGMKNRIFDISGKKSVILPIPCDSMMDSKKKEGRKNQIMFLGNINRLYLEGLKDIAEIIDKINSEKKLEIKLRFTYKTITEVKRIIGNYRCISSRRIDDEKQLMDEMENSLFCFMPFSDDNDFYLMQNTSFPSKLIEYMSSACSIVVYGNDKNTAQEYFDENDLPVVIYGRNKVMLEKCILRHIETYPDFSSEYKNVLRYKHSFNSIEQKISWCM